MDGKLTHKITEIYNDTKGDPILVKFSVFSRGLEQDVEEMSNRYLVSPQEMKTMLICSIFDISNTEITDKLLEKCGVLEAAHRLDGSILHRNSDGLWKTKHTRWDLELFSFLYNVKSGTLSEQRKQVLKDSLIAIYLIREKDITYSAVVAIYCVAGQNYVPINVVDAVFQQSISQIALSDVEQSNHASFISLAYWKLKNYQGAIDNLTHALEINPRNIMAYFIKAYFLMELGRYGEAVQCLQKELEIDPSGCKVNGELLNISAFHAFSWLWLGICYHNLGMYQEVIRCYDKALKNHLNLPETWHFKGQSLQQVGGKDAQKFLNRANNLLLELQNYYQNMKDDKRKRLR